jgi:hypothetical protein
MTCLRALIRLFCLSTALSATLLFGQFESGTVLGSVDDPSGAAVPGAKVSLENVTTNVVLDTTTDTNGNYEFVNVRLGSYRVRVTAQGFETATTDPFELQVNARQRVDVALKVGQTSENVTVIGAAELLETENSSRGQVINTKEIVDLPLNGRSYADLTLLVPGVARSKTKATAAATPLSTSMDNAAS